MNPTRRAIFEIVAYGMSIGKTVKAYGLNPNTLRMHLHYLEREGFIRRVPGVYPLRFVYTGAGSLIRDLQKNGGKLK